VAWATYAVVQRDMGQAVEAKASFEQALRIDETGLGRGPHEQFTTQVQLAQLAHNSGRYRDAVSQAQAALKFAEVKLGDIGDQLSAPRRIVVFAAEREGDFDVAKLHADRLLAAELASQDATRVGAAQVAWARIHLSANRLSDAKAALDFARQAVGGHITWSARIAAFQTEWLLRNREPQKAADLMDQELVRLRQVLAPKHPELGSLLEMLGIARARLGRWQAADSALAEACEVRALTRNAHHPQWVRCKAYRLLIAPELSGPARRQALADLESGFVAAQSSPTGLLISLRALIASERRANAHLQRPELFPILN
jgi:tetratricopeptide (TPR) repeat protein